LTTAEGGALYLNLPPSFEPSEIARWIRIYSLHGQTKDAFAKATGASYHYDIVAAGYKCNMTDLQAALGRAQLPQYDAALARRHALAERYAAGLADDPRFLLPPLSDGTRLSAFHLYPLRLRGCTPERRDAVIDALRAEGIATNMHFLPLPLLTVHRERGETLAPYPGAAAWHAEEISLPLHLALTDDDVDRVVEAVRRLAP
jgi:dTDP-4-amino-4,6-dideoxygalactose transaminase